MDLRYCKLGHIWAQANVGGLVFYKHQLLFMIILCTHILLEYECYKSRKHGKFYLFENFSWILQNFGSRDQKLSSISNDKYTFIKSFNILSIVFVKMFFEKQSFRQKIYAPTAQKWYRYIHFWTTAYILFWVVYLCKSDYTSVNIHGIDTHRHPRYLFTIK